MERFNFTQAAIDALPLPVTGRSRYYDSKEPYLTLRVSPAGSKVFYFYRWVKGTARQIKIGEYPFVGLHTARERARELAVSLAHGEDPIEQKRAAKSEPKLKDLYAWYLESYAKIHKRSWKQDEYRWKYLLRLADSQLSNVTRQQVLELQLLIAKQHGQPTANNAISLLSGMWKQALWAGYTTVPNPCQQMRYFKLESRARRLQPEEATRFFSTLDRWWNVDLKHIVLLALYTGQRKADVLAMRWDQLDLTEGQWRIPRTKSGKPHTVPLEAEELAILKGRKDSKSASPWVFPSHSGDDHLKRIEGSWKSFTNQAGVSDLRFHDLRRTLGSWMADTGAGLPLIGKALAHSTSKATEIYARPDLEPVRKAKSRAIQAMHNSRQRR